MDCIECKNLEQGFESRLSKYIGPPSVEAAPQAHFEGDAAMHSLASSVVYVRLSRAIWT
jgi:hypothetical protein